MALLRISLVILIFLSLHSYLNFLTVLILVIVYVGAIIVLIGYICAISPNLTLEPNYSNLNRFFLFILAFYFFSPSSTPLIEISTATIADYFYTSQGVFMFLALILMLFITLLMVTSQYSVPKGPFRSIRV